MDKLTTNQSHDLAVKIEELRHAPGGASMMRWILWALSGHDPVTGETDIRKVL